MAVHPKTGKEPALLSMYRGRVFLPVVITAIIRGVQHTARFSSLHGGLYSRIYLHENEDNVSRFGTYPLALAAHRSFGAACVLWHRDRNVLQMMWVHRCKSVCVCVVYLSRARRSLVGSLPEFHKAKVAASPFRPWVWKPLSKRSPVLFYDLSITYMY